MTDLRLQDSFYQFSELTEDERRIFNNRYQKSRPYEFPDNVHVQVTYEFNLDLHRIDRDVYSVLDWISDIGGLKDGLILVIIVVVSFLNFYKFDHYLIENLFVKRD